MIVDHGRFWEHVAHAICLQALWEIQQLRDPRLAAQVHKAFSATGRFAVAVRCTTRVLEWVADSAKLGERTAG